MLVSCFVFVVVVVVLVVLLLEVHFLLRVRTCLTHSEMSISKRCMSVWFYKNLSKVRIYTLC